MEDNSSYVIPDKPISTGDKLADTFAFYDLIVAELGKCKCGGNIEENEAIKAELIKIKDEIKEEIITLTSSLYKENHGEDSVTVLDTGTHIFIYTYAFSNDILVKELETAIYPIRKGSNKHITDVNIRRGLQYLRKSSNAHDHNIEREVGDLVRLNTDKIYFAIKQMLGFPIGEIL